MQTPSLIFTHPAFWLLLPFAAALFWALARRGGGYISPSAWQATLLRCAAAALVIGAISGPVTHWLIHGRGVVFLVDESRSISPAARGRELAMVRSAIGSKASSDMVGVTTFGATTDLTAALSVKVPAIEGHVPVDDESTDLGAGLRAAAGQLAAGGGGRIVLLSDGRETAQSGGSGLDVAASGGVPVYAVDPAAFLGSTTQPEASVARVDMPTIVHEDEPVALQAVVVSSLEQTARISATADGKVLAARQAALAAGKTLVSLPIKLRGAGIRRVSVSVDAPVDTLLENNAASALTCVIGQPRVLYLTDSPESIAPTLQRAMRARSIALDVKPALEAPNDVAGFASYDGVVLSNVPASELSRMQQTALQSAVGDFGVGLGMVGGTSSFIGGGWRGTPVEATLPVTMQPRSGKKIPPADVVVVLDASNSMSAEENGVEKVQLGARAAVALLGTLQPVDRVAVISVTETPTIVLPFSDPKHALAARTSIEGVEAGGGGIYCRTGLEAAYDLLDTSHAAIKHVVLVADATDSEEQQDCVALARRLRIESHVTTSVCGIGDWGDSDVGFQKDVASAGGGQLYEVSQASDLPTFFQRDISHVQAPPYEEGSFMAHALAGDPLVAGINIASGPPLLGYNLAKARSTAVVALRAPGEPDPIFAYGSFGLGRTFAFTSDEDAHWAIRWLPWTGYGEFWSRVLRWSLRRERPANFEAYADLGLGVGSGRVVVDAFEPDGGYLNGGSFQAVIAGPSPAGSQAVHIALTQTEPGRYEAAFPAGAVGQYLVSVSRPNSLGSGSALVGVSRPYPAEYAQAPPDVALLSAISGVSGGRLLAGASDIWKQPEDRATGSRGIAGVWLVLGLLVFVLDVAFRRLGWRVRLRTSAREPIAEIAERLRGSREAVGRARERIAAGSLATWQPPDSARSLRNGDELLARPIGRRVGSEELAASGAAATEKRQTGVGGSGAETSGEEEAFPLVASLDELRRRERVQ